MLDGAPTPLPPPLSTPHKLSVPTVPTIFGTGRHRVGRSRRMKKMSLDYDMTKLTEEGFEFAKANPNMTEVVIFGCMFSGIGKLDFETIDEFYARMTYARELIGGIEITMEDL